MAFNRWLLALVIFLTIYVYTNMHTSYYKSVSCWSCSTLWTWTCDPMDCSLPGSSVHRILQARMLEWVAIPFSRGSSQPRDQTWVSCIAGRFFTILNHQGNQATMGIHYFSLFLKKNSKVAHFSDLFVVVRMCLAELSIKYQKRKEFP